MSVKISDRFRRLVEGTSNEVNFDFTKVPVPEMVPPSPLRRGITEQRLKESIKFARSVEFLEEPLVVFYVLRSEGRITREQEEELAKMLGWKRGLAEIFNSEVGRNLSQGIGNILEAIAKRIKSEANRVDNKKEE